MISGYIIHLGVLLAIFSILAVAFNLAIGYTGILNLGHIALFAIGAYTSALLTKAGLPFIIAFLLAGLVPTIVGVFLVLATGRVRNDYLMLATLGFHYVVRSILLNWTSVTRGPLGIPGITKPNVFNFTIANNNQYLLFSFIIAILTIGIMWRVVNSPFGNLLQATRDDETHLKVLGKDIVKIKVKAIAISAFFAGIAGSLFAHYISFIDPGSFALNEIVLVITIAIVGGLATIRGTLVATAIILLLPEMLRFFPLPSTILGPARQIIYALILLAILLYKPRGIFGRIDVA